MFTVYKLKQLVQIHLNGYKHTIEESRRQIYDLKEWQEFQQIRTGVCAGLNWGCAGPMPWAGLGGMGRGHAADEQMPCHWAQLALEVAKDMFGKASISLSCFG
uniref:Uncharacterized protein n=1 Tax=Meleagris gallopavo TaxID=9103 RepID=A0A803XLE8_MELGA